METVDGQMTWLKARVHYDCGLLPTEATGGIWGRPMANSERSKAYTITVNC